MKSIYNKEYKLFIDMLKEYRVKKKLTQSQLADKLEWANHSYVSKYESNERRIDFIEFRNVCLVIRISPIKFMKEFEDRLKEGK